MDRDGGDGNLHDVSQLSLGGKDLLKIPLVRTRVLQLQRLDGWGMTGWADCNAWA